MLGAAALGGAVLATAASESLLERCDGRDCPGGALNLLSGAAFLLVLTAAGAFAWAVPRGERLRARVKAATFAAGVVAVGLFLAVMMSTSTCTTMDAGPAVCSSTGVPPDAMAGVALALVLAAALFVAGAARLLLLAPAGSPARQRGLRVALGALGAFLLLLAVSIARWWAQVPRGTEWAIEAGHACARWTTAYGGGESCMGVSQLVTAPILALAAVGAGAQAWSPRRVWAGHAAAALAGLAALVVATMNAFAVAKNDWVTLAALAAGLVLASRLVAPASS